MRAFQPYGLRIRRALGSELGSRTSASWGQLGARINAEKRPAHIYAHALPSMQKDAAAKMASLLR